MQPCMNSLTQLYIPDVLSPPQIQSLKKQKNSSALAALVDLQKQKRSCQPSSDSQSEDQVWLIF